MKAMSVCVLSVGLLTTSVASASLVVDDTFEDGGRSNGTDPLDITWYRANQNLNLSVVDDAFAGGGSTKALDIDIGNIDAFKRIVGQFDPITLGAANGNYIELRFDIRAVSAPPNNQNGFRFGLYNSAGDMISADETQTSWNPIEGNDYGYNARIPTGTANTPSLYDEPAGDNTLGGTTPGTTITDGGASSIGISDTSLHQVTFRLTRTGDTSVGFTLAYDGTPVATATDSSGIYTAFDQVYFGSGSSNNFDYRLDNVQIEVVPEPATLSLTLCGLLVGGLCRRVRRS